MDHERHSDLKMAALRGALSPAEQAELEGLDRQRVKWDAERLRRLSFSATGVIEAR